MILDSQNLFSDAQALTAAAASTNLIDLGLFPSGATPARDIGTGKTLYVILNVDVALTDAGSDTTVDVTLEQDDNAGFSSATNIQALLTIPATSAIGANFFAVIAPGVVTEQFIRLQYTMVNGDLTTGSVTAAIVTAIDNSVVYPDNIVIS